MVSTPENDLMKAGFHLACVTPPLGMAMEGLGQPRGCEAIHDDLYVRALYFVHGGQEALLVGYDLLFFERPEIQLFKEALGRRLKLTAEQILINTSHNHAGPRLTHWAYSDGADRGYIEQILNATLTAADEAKASARAVRVEAGMARTRLPVSRRKPDSAGIAQWAPYPKGTICDALPFCLFRDTDGHVVSLLFSVSCHPSMIYECVISAEYPGAAMRHLNQHFQTQGAFFLQGAGGDTKPRQIAVGSDHWGRGTWEQMEEAGAEVAQSVIAQANHGLLPVEPELKFCRLETEWPLQAIPARRDFEAVLADQKERPARRVWAGDMIRQSGDGTLSPVAKVGLHALQIGHGVRLIGLEGEAVGELGNAILKAYPQGVTFPMGYTDGCQLYLPVNRMLNEGGYEVESYWEYHYPAPLALGCELVLEKTLRELRESGKLPA